MDLDGSEIAREPWRSMKANRLGLSFGYVVTESHKAADGVLDLTEIDLFEITVSPAPVNADTRSSPRRQLATERRGAAPA